MVDSGLVALQVGRICWQIGERAMVPKDVRELLYQLLKDHYIQVQVCYSLDVAKLTPLLWKDLYLSNALVLAPVTFSLQSFWASRYWALVFKYRNDSLFHPCGYYFCASIWLRASPPTFSMWRCIGNLGLGTAVKSSESTWRLL